MNILAVDTTGDNLNILLLKGEKAYSHCMKNAAKQHSVYIYDAINTAIVNGGISLNDIDVFACVTGPGSFTGIRIGICAIKALCFALNKKCAPLTSFDIAAYYKEKGIIVPVVSAGKGNCYLGVFDKGEELLNPRFAAFSEAEEIADKYNALLFTYDENEECYFKAFEKAVLKAVKKPIDSVQLTPFYLRLSQAEREAECK